MLLCICTQHGVVFLFVLCRRIGKECVIWCEHNNGKAME